jgi:Spy/CpxP family protein refolding chaperone
MNTTRRGFTILFASFLIASLFGVSNAVAGAPGGFGHDHLARLLASLDLTDAQKTAAGNILKQNEVNARNIATGLASARVQLAKDVLSGSDQSVISADSQNVAAYAAQAAQLGSQIVAQIIPILSADQKTTLQSLHDKIGVNIDSSIDRRFARLDKWIAKHQ